MMTGAASNYDVNRLHVGIIVALAAEVFLLLSFILTRPSLQLQSTLFSALTLLYGIMMFASSYVEEEHHIWYWYGSLWIASLCILR
jgi:ethanolaminephosphotransferase